MLEHGKQPLHVPLSLNKAGMMVSAGGCQAVDGPWHVMMLARQAPQLLTTASGNGCRWHRQPIMPGRMESANCRPVQAIPHRLRPPQHTQQVLYLTWAHTPAGWGGHRLTPLQLPVLGALGDAQGLGFARVKLAHYVWQLADVAGHVWVLQQVALQRVAGSRPLRASHGLLDHDICVHRRACSCGLEQGG